MKRFTLALALLASSLSAQSKTPAKTPACVDSAGALRFAPVYSVGAATIRNACPAYRNGVHADIKHLADSVGADFMFRARDLPLLAARWFGPDVNAPTPPPVVTLPPVVTPPVPPSPPPQTGAGVIFAHDFNDGTLGPFTTNAGSLGNSVAVVDDPTSSGRGKLVALRYRSPAAAVSTGYDWRIQAKPPAGFGFGSSLFVAWDLYFGPAVGGYANGSVQRKLLDLRTNNETQPLGVVRLRTYALGPSMEWVQAGTIAGSRTTDFAGAAFLPNRWYRVDVEITPESAPGKSDGALRVWVDRVLVQEYAAINFLAPGETRSPRFDQIWIGSQREPGSNEGTIDEFRYIDNVVLSARRMTP